MLFLNKKKHSACFIFIYVRCRPPLSASDKVVFSLMRDHQIPLMKSSKLEGTAETTLSELLQKSGSQTSDGTVPNVLSIFVRVYHLQISDISLPLLHKSKMICTLTIRIRQTSNNAWSGKMANTAALPAESASHATLGVADATGAAGAAGAGVSEPGPVDALRPLTAEQRAAATAVTPEAINAARGVTNLLSSDPSDPLSAIPAKQKAPILIAVADKVGSAGDVVTGLAQSDVIGSFETLLDKVDFVLKIGNELSKVRLYRFFRRAFLIHR